MVFRVVIHVLIFTCKLELMCSLIKSDSCNVMFLGM